MYGGILGGPNVPRQYDSAAAGKPSTRLNSSFSAYDYKQSHLDNSRSFMMDDYVNSGRAARSQPPASVVSDSCWELMHHRGGSSSQFQPMQGVQETKFHKGFQRRQEPQIQQDAARKDAELRKVWLRISCQPRHPAQLPTPYPVLAKPLHPSSPRPTSHH